MHENQWARPFVFVFHPLLSKGHAVALCVVCFDPKHSPSQYPVESLVFSFGVEGWCPVQQSQKSKRVASCDNKRVCSVDLRMCMNRNKKKFVFDIEWQTREGVVCQKSN